MGRVDPSRKPGILAGRVGLGWVTISVGRVGSHNFDPRATLFLQKLDYHIGCLLHL